MSREEALSSQDLSSTDLRSLTPAEWDALKREVQRRAHAGRADVLRAAAGAIRAWWRARTGMTSASLRLAIQSRV
jgi:hypothetical protein